MATATLSGVPGTNHVGDENPVVLMVKDWDGETDMQPFSITVYEQDEFELFLPLILR